MALDIFVTKTLDSYKRWDDPDNPEYKIIHVNSIDDNELITLHALATKLNLKCLQFLDPVMDVMFNHLQAQEIMYELALIKNDPNISKNVILSLEKAIKLVVNNKHLYIHFEGD